MAKQPTESGPSGPFVQLRKHAEKMGIPRGEADQVLRAVLKRLRQKNPKVSETLFYVAGLTALSRFSHDKARLGSPGSALAPSAGAWSETDDSVASVMTAEERERVRDGVQGLPDDVQAIYRMLILDNKTYAEIAQQLGASVESVRASVFRAKEILRARLALLVMPSG